MEPDYFIPPSLVPQSTPITLPSPTALVPSPTPECTNNLQFLEDVTIPDGTGFAPGVTLVKIWKVLNSGNCNWDSRYRIRLISGDELGAEPEQALFPARSGTEVEISITFIAPDSAGLYQSSWQAYDPDGDSFGDPFFIVINVDPDLAVDDEDLEEDGDN